MRLLLVEDESALRNALAEGLRGQGWAVDEAADGPEGWWHAEQSCHDLVVLDLMLPGFDGYEVLRRMRAAGIATPVLLLTARDAVDDRVRGLDAGADDYLAKPFAVAELLARLRSLVRRGRRSGPVRLTVGDLVVDTVSRRVERAGRAVLLTPKEYALLEMLARRAGSLVTKAEIRDHLYAFEAEANSNVVDVLIGRLRRKIQAEGEPAVLWTRRGHGVVLSDQPAP